MSSDIQGRVLVSTHDLGRAGAIRTALEESGYTVDLVTPGEDVRSEVPIQLLIITAQSDSRSAYDLSEQARVLSQAPVFAIAEDVESISNLSGEYTEVFTPDTRADELVFVARSVIERRNLQAMAGIVGETDAMKEALERVVQFAPVSSTVLVTGESGTGKELIARGIHHLSPRRHQPFIPVNVAALSDTLLESELFGHEKGSFTGAIDSRQGLFELANGGTIFLDEIGEMPLTTQTKILRVLEQKEFHKVGGEAVINVDVRIVTATNQNLKQLVSVGQFRKDLYYRLNVLHIELPPLRQRWEDIPILVEAFIEDACVRLDRTFEGISSDAMKILQEYHWPGNIRELHNLIESMVVLSPGREVLPKDIPKEIRSIDKSLGALIPIDQGSPQSADITTGPGLRPELEFIFRTLVDLRMDVDDLRKEFDLYRDKNVVISSTTENYPLDDENLEITVRHRDKSLGDEWVAEGIEKSYPEIPHDIENSEVIQPSSVIYESGMTMDDLEREAISMALAEVRGNRRKAAELLSIGERTLYRKIKKFGIDEN